MAISSELKKLDTWLPKSPTLIKKLYTWLPKSPTLIISQPLRPNFSLIRQRFGISAVHKSRTRIIGQALRPEIMLAGPNSNKWPTSSVIAGCSISELHRTSGYIG